MAGNDGMNKATIVITPSTSSAFTIEVHNKVQETIDGVVKELQNFNAGDDIELREGIKALLEASGRVNAYYRSINNPLKTGKANELKEEHKD